MLARLEAAFESQRRFVANASHELRTPLAIVRTELDVTLDDPDADTDELRAMAHVVQDANERMERLIASLLALASSEGGIAQSRPADLAQIVRPALEREAFSDGTLQLEASLAPAPVLGDPVLLERLAENLLENAVRYNAAVGWVRVRTGVQRGEAVLEVANPGARIDPADVEGLLEPFRRLESSRSRSTGGYGLGLAVVRAVAQSHGGRVAVLARREGGLEVTVALPLAAADAAEPVVTAPARA
jgi:signal transduction histidine kinase